MDTYFNIFVYVWIALALIVFPINLKITAPYGRHTKKSWGPLIANKLGWILMEVPALTVFVYFFLTGTASKNLISWIFFGFWTLHYVNRTLIFPFRIKTKGKKMPLMIIFSAIFFNLINGFINGYYLGSIGNYDVSCWLIDPRFIIGILLFIIGLVINWQSDYILINIRKPGETGYKIPKGGLFKYISCPNHFGEIIEWFGFALMTWSLPALAFAIWTAANLIPRTLKHHEWYHQKFSDYPKERKAVIPFVL